jgi:hypothetical protein
VPVGLMPMAALGAAAAVPTPAIDALITLVCAMTGKSFAAEARTLVRMGLGGMDAPQIMRFVEIGSIQNPASPLGAVHVEVRKRQDVKPIASS